ncbi:heme-binding protein [Mesorhizobium sp. M0323]|uniref:GlcG/HbpS family heme-binding protein n=1 Tax=Mesorhizobium sp. M0323 TaxID=2956938 RepID=UPI00333AEB31
MDGARFLSMRTAQAKARTAASINAATGGMAFEAALSAGIASQGGVTNLPGGLPIRFGGRLAGGIGVESGTGEQDFDVAHAALAAVGADVISCDVPMRLQRNRRIFRTRSEPSWICFGHRRCRKPRPPRREDRCPSVAV